MIPSTAPPFAMTRWVAQTRANYVSVTPYNNTDRKVHGFQGTHQPAIWMGESGTVAVVPGAGRVRAEFADRGMGFSKEVEMHSPSYYAVQMEAAEGGTIRAEQSASACLVPLADALSYFIVSIASRVGHLRFTFNKTSVPYVLLEATRPSVVGSSSPTNLTYPSGTLSIDPSVREICGSNPERQDSILGPNKAEHFAGYFCARFDAPFARFGTVQNGTVRDGEATRNGSVLAGYAMFANDTAAVDVRVGVSFISIEQARGNIDNEVPDGTSLEETARSTREAWAEKLDRLTIEGASAENLTTFYTAVFHSLQASYSCFLRQALMLTGLRSTRMSRAKTEGTTLDTMIQCTKAIHTRATRSG
jgi:putative alpha-1,2-mannosidase